jgi:hypothetical protein
MPSMLMPEFFGTFLDDTYWGGRNFWELSLYVGVFPLILCVISFFSKSDEEAEMFKKIFLSLTILSILYAFGSYFPIFSFIYYLPFFSMMRKPSIILFLSAFSMAILSGFGVDKLEGLLKKTRKDHDILSKRISTLVKVLIVGAVLSSVTIVAAYLQKDMIMSFGEDLLEKRYKDFNDNVHPLKYGLEYYMGKIEGAYGHIMKSMIIFTILSTLSVVFLYSTSNKIISQKKFRTMMFLIILLDLWLFGMKYIQTEDPGLMLPPGTDRCDYESWRTDDVQTYRIFDTLDLNSLEGTSDCFSQYLTMRQGVETIWGDDSTVLDRYKNFTDYTINLFNGSETFDFNPDSKILGMMNVKYVITKEPIYEDGLVLDHVQDTYEYAGYLKTSSAKEVYVYENEEFLPRAYVVYGAKIIEDDEDVLRYMMSQEFDPRENVILQEDIGNVWSETTKDTLDDEYTEAAFIQVSPQEFDVQFQIDRPGFLVISQNWYPGWIAYDNNIKSDVIRGNYAFTAFPVGSGYHEIKFVYAPDTLKTGTWITCATIAFLFVCVLYYQLFKTDGD